MPDHPKSRHFRRFIKGPKSADRRSDLSRFAMGGEAGWSGLVANRSATGCPTAISPISSSRTRSGLPFVQLRHDVTKADEKIGKLGMRRRSIIRRRRDEG